MYFNPTPTNMVAVLVCTLSVIGIFMLMRKRYDSNLPLLFYFFAVPFSTMFERPVHPYLMFGGLGFALLLRFEFMGPSFTKFVAFFAGVGLVAMTWVMLGETSS